MPFDFNKFGTTEENKQKTMGGFDFASFGSPSLNLTKTLTPDQKSASEYGAIFPSKQGESGFSAGLKAIGNLPSSAFNLAKGVGNIVANPVKTIEGIGGAIGEPIGTLAGYGITAGKEALGLAPKGSTQAYNLETQKFNVVADALKERYGSLENLQRTATNDPFGFGLDILTALEGGAGVLGKTGELNRVLETGSKVVTKPAEIASQTLQKTTKFGVSQATGLNPETITNIIKNPEAFTPQALAETNRTTLGSAVKSAIDERLNNLSDIGQGYNTIREGSAQVSIPLNSVDEILNKYGIKVVDGKVKITSEAKPLTTADKTALEDFLNVYGNETQLSSNAFLNTRSALSQLSKYDAAKTGNLTPIARDLRKFYDTLGKEQIPGLSQLDAQYAPEVEILNKIKKDYIDVKTGGFKDGAINKIANLTGPGKEQVLERLNRIVPGIEQRIKIVKAAEDIEKASGLKLGTYARAGAGVLGVATANIPAILAAIVASPDVAVRLLRSYGIAKEGANEIARLLRVSANDLTNFKIPGKYSDYMDKYFGIGTGIQNIQNKIENVVKNPKMGLSLEDVSKNTGNKFYIQGKDGKMIGSIPRSKIQTVDTSRFKLGGDFQNAVGDVTTGQKSMTNLPILVKENTDGTLEILDGNHRLAEAFRENKNTVDIMTDEKLYRQLSDKVDETPIKKSISTNKK